MFTAAEVGQTYDAGYEAGRQDEARRSAKRDEILRRLGEAAEASLRGDKDAVWRLSFDLLTEEELRDQE
jgi:hypothetical protein